jgi:hypothetical protein
LDAHPPQATICVRRLVCLWVKIFWFFSMVDIKVLIDGKLANLPSGKFAVVRADEPMHADDKHIAALREIQR